MVIVNMNAVADKETDTHSDNESNSDGETGNAGWADSIAKVLNTSKPQKRKTLVLSRAKKFTTPKGEEEKPKYEFEIDGETEKETSIVPKNVEEEPKKTRNVKLALRNKPSVKDFERERALKKIATRGVVQLFNAIRTQQRDIDDEIKNAGPLDHKRDAVLQNINKKKFLDVLMSGKRSKSEAVDNEVKDEIKDEDQSEEEFDDSAVKKRKSEWSVLRDDFMTNKKLKNWDQEDSEDADDGEDDSDDE